MLREKEYLSYSGHTVTPVKDISTSATQALHVPIQYGRLHAQPQLRLLTLNQSSWSPMESRLLMEA